MLRGVGRLLERLLFRPSEAKRPDRLLGMLVLGLALLGAWLIFWPLIPPLLAGIVTGIIETLSAPRAVEPQPAPTVVPSPSPAPQ